MQSKHCSTLHPKFPSLFSATKIETTCSSYSSSSSLELHQIRLRLSQVSKSVEASTTRRLPHDGSPLLLTPFRLWLCSEFSFCECFWLQHLERFSVHLVCQQNNTESGQIRGEVAP